VIEAMPSIAINAGTSLSLGQNVFYAVKLLASMMSIADIADTTACRNDLNISHFGKEFVGNGFGSGIVEGGIRAVAKVSGCRFFNFSPLTETVIRVKWECYINLT
jgi:hypothetical protein